MFKKIIEKFSVFCFSLAVNKCIKVKLGGITLFINKMVK